MDAANPEIWQSLKKMFNEPYAEAYMSKKLTWCRKCPIHVGISIKIAIDSQSLSFLIKEYLADSNH